MKFLKNKQKNKGFVIMIAVLVSSMLISIGIFIAIIALKELQLSSSSKDSQKAFYAADSAIECALHHELRTGVSGGPFPQNTEDIDESLVSSTINCNGQNVKIYHSGNQYDEPIAPTGMEDIRSEISHGNNNGMSISYFEISFVRFFGDEDENEDNQPYARVKIYKNDIGGRNDQTILQAYGHNKKSGAGIVERALKVTY